MKEKNSPKKKKNIIPKTAIEGKALGLTRLRLALRGWANGQSVSLGCIGRDARRRFEVMDAMKNEHPVTEMADALSVSASGYADHQNKEARPR